TQHHATAPRGQEDSMRATKAQHGQSATARERPDWAELLVKAVTTPGVVSTAYSRFWNYSVGNQILALFQCLQRRIEPGPIHTFVGWRELGRHVKKGEKALTLCMPVTVKRRRNHASSAPPSGGSADAPREVTAGASDDEAETRTCFVYRPHWF